MKDSLMRASPSRGATDSVALEYSGPTLCRLEALDTYRPLVIGLWRLNTIIFIRSVVPIGT